MRRGQRALFPYVFDSSSLIQVEQLGLMALLRQVSSSVIVPRRVANEIGKRRAMPLATWLASHWDCVTEFATSAEGEPYLRLRRQLEIHDADAAAIAVARCRGKGLVVEDRAARQKAENHSVRCWSLDKCPLFADQHGA
jgi:predicted nucleic acid-binding protein